MRVVKAARFGDANYAWAKARMVFYLWGVILLVAADAVAAYAQEPAPASDMQTLDRVVAVVNNQPILWSDITKEIRFAVLDPNEVNGTVTPKRALQQLISRTLIEQQIGQEDATVAQPSDQDVQARVNAIRKELPACARLKCTTEAGWQEFLKTNELSAGQVEKYIRLRLEILRFIEIRFRQGIRIAHEEVEAYYRDKLLPQYAKGARVPPLSEVSSRIEEILLEQQVNVMFDNWLDSLRKQGNVEVLDASLESASPGSAGSEKAE
jgi:peptidyl-prolyl cis-trans isomerase SurA